MLGGRVEPIGKKIWRGYDGTNYPEWKTVEPFTTTKRLLDIRVPTPLSLDTLAQRTATRIGRLENLESKQYEKFKAHRRTVNKKLRYVLNALMKADKDEVFQHFGEKKKHIYLKLQTRRNQALNHTKPLNTSPYETWLIGKFGNLENFYRDLHPLKSELDGIQFRPPRRLRR
jgi:hypothetical protein